MNACKSLIENLAKADYDKVMNDEDVFIPMGDEKYRIEKEDLILDRVVHEGLIAAFDNGITVALDTRITPELELEGIARELINKVNTMRKAHDFQVTDRIEITLSRTDKLEKALVNHGDFVSHEVLAVKLELKDTAFGEKIDLNGEEVFMTIVKST